MKQEYEGKQYTVTITEDEDGDAAEDGDGIEGGDGTEDAWPGMYDYTEW